MTILKVPNTTQTTAVTAEEGVSLTTCAANLLDCRTTTMTINNVTFGTPGTRPLAQFLEATLLRDASTIAKGAQIDSAVLYYKHDLIGTGFGEEILSCADISLPKLQTPCEDRNLRKAFPKRNTTKTPVAPGFESDWRFVIYLFDNGRITN